MSKKTQFTTITPLPQGISRETVLSTLHDHLEMIDLAPTHEDRHMIKPPPEASPEEYHCQWYQITDKISYLPGVKGRVHFKACFHDLTTGVQIHNLAPMGLDIKQKWTLGGNLPHEPVQPAEIGIGAPISGLYLREDVEIRCNIFVTRFVRKELKSALKTLVDRLLVKSNLQEAIASNHRLTQNATSMQQYTPPTSPPRSPPLSLMSQAVYSTPPNSAPLNNAGFKPEWAQGLGIKPPLQSRASLPPLPTYNPQDYVPMPVSEMEGSHGVANNSLQQQVKWSTKPTTYHHQPHPSQHFAELPGN